MAQLQRRFPLELLNKSPEERLNYYEKKNINHPMIEKKLTEVLRALKTRGQQNLIFVFGPSHVGKSKLAKIVRDRLLEDVNPEIVEEGPVLVEVVPPQTNSSIWKDFYVRVLTEMQEILIDKKVEYAKDRIISSGLGRTSSAPHLRIAVENCLTHRNPKALLLDEAQSFTRIPSTKSVLDQTDNLKSLVNKTSVPIVMFGNYELMEMRDLSDQLINRSIDIHFPRYHYENGGDREAFKNLLLSYEQHIPIESESNLVEHIDFCYERTIGCGGALHKLLYKALSNALYDENPKGIITKKHLQLAAPTPAKVKKLLEFAKWGEEQLFKEKAEAEVSTLREALGMSLEALPSRKVQRSKPGVRKAERDNVGTSGLGVRA